MNVTLTADDGREYDITEHFQVMYDNLVGGMDWGSGFLDGNDALIVMQAGAAAGFEVKVEHDSGSMLAKSSPAEKAFPYPTRGSDYYKLMRTREKWVKEQLGNPPTWDSIAAYRQRLQEMENDNDEEA